MGTPQFREHWSDVWVAPETSHECLTVLLALATAEAVRGNPQSSGCQSLLSGTGWAGVKMQIPGPRSLHPDLEFPG